MSIQPISSTNTQPQNPPESPPGQGVQFNKEQVGYIKSQVDYIKSIVAEYNNTIKKAEEVMNAPIPGYKPPKRLLPQDPVMFEDKRKLFSGHDGEIVKVYTDKADWQIEIERRKFHEARRDSENALKEKIKLEQLCMQQKELEVKNNKLDANIARLKKSNGRLSRYTLFFIAILVYGLLHMIERRWVKKTPSLTS